VATAGNVTGDEWASHCCRFEERTRKALAVGRKHDGGGARDEWSNVLRRAEMFDDPVAQPCHEFVVADSGPVGFVEPAEELEASIGEFCAESTRSLDKLDHALVAEQTPDEEKHWRALGQGRWHKMVEIDTRSWQHPGLVRSDDPDGDALNAEVAHSPVGGRILRRNHDRLVAGRAKAPDQPLPEVRDIPVAVRGKYDGPRGHPLRQALSSWKRGISTSKALPS